MLAVSDPAADVTSTQTWRALEEGRATGIWTMPRELDGGVSPGPGERADEGKEATQSAAPAVPAADGTSRTAGARTAIADRTAVADRTGQAGAAPSALQNADRPSDRAARGSRADGRRSGGRSQSSRRAGSPSRRSRPASVKVAIVVSVVLVIGAAAVLAYKVLHPGSKPGTTAGAAARSAASATPSASPSQSLGAYGHIASRSSDPQPLTVQQLYPASFAISGSTVTQTASGLSKHCGATLTGSKIQSAVSKAGCNQVVRATYLFSAKGLMGTIGVLNLSTAARATKTARSADASDYITPLAARRGPTKKIGGGTGIEEAAAKGHYLILIWAEYTSLRRPKTGAQRAELVNFMSALLRSTANVSLTNRMLTGTP